MDKRQEAAQAAQRLAAEVDRTISEAVPTLADLQVAAAADMVIISGLVPSVQERQRAEEAARSVPGVRHLVNSLTVS